METSLTDAELLEIQVAVLFVHDARGRLVSVNETDEPEPSAAPRFFWGRTRAGSICRLRHDVPEDVGERLVRIVEDEPVEAELAREPRGLAAARTILEAQAPLRRTYNGPAYRFPDRIPESTDVVAVTEGSQDALGPKFAWLRASLAAHQPCFAVVAGGWAVSVCNSARATSLAAEAGVETIEGFRGRGYAQRVALAWAAAVRQQGRIPLYSTWWENAASRGVAGKLGLVQYGVDLHFT